MLQTMLLFIFWIAYLVTRVWRHLRLCWCRQHSLLCFDKRILKFLTLCFASIFFFLMNVWKKLEFILWHCCRNRIPRSIWYIVVMSTSYDSFFGNLNNINLTKTSNVTFETHFPVQGSFYLKKDVSLHSLIYNIEMV